MDNRFDLGKEEYLEKIKDIEKNYKDLRSKKWDIDRQVDAEWDKLNEIKLEYFNNYVNMFNKYILLEHSNETIVLLVTRVGNYVKGKEYELELDGIGYYESPYRFWCGNNIAYSISEHSLHVFNDYIENIKEITEEEYNKRMKEFISKLSDKITSNINNE